MVKKACACKHLGMKMRSFGQRIKYYRQHAGLTQEEAAGRAKIATMTFQRLERGIGNPTIGSLEAIAEALNCSVADLYSAGPDAPFEARPTPQDLKALIELAGPKLPWGPLSLILESFSKAPPAIRAAILAVLYDDVEIAKGYLPEKAATSSKVR